MTAADYDSVPCTVLSPPLNVPIPIFDWFYTHSGLSALSTVYPVFPESRFSLAMLCKVIIPVLLFWFFLAKKNHICTSHLLYSIDITS